MAQSSALGAGAHEALWSLLADCPGGAVLESWWPTSARPFVSAGLARAGIEPRRTAEVWCDVPAESPATGISNASRLGRRSTAAPTGWRCGRSGEAAAAQPLGLGAVVRIGTAAPLDPRAVARLALEVRAALA